MKFTSLASSSKGNAYLLQSEGVAPLLLEAGIPINRLRNLLRDYWITLPELAGCLISHEHQDHSKAVKDLLKAGIDCCLSNGTAEELGVESHHRFYRLTAGSLFQLLAWTIIPFKVEHDAQEPLGFFVSHGEDRFLFIPDTSYVENRFRGITMIAAECNNISEILSKNILEGNLPAVVGKRIRRNHFNLENLKAFLLANDLSRCHEIWLLHLSDGNSDERRMIKEIQEITGIPTHAA